MQLTKNDNAQAGPLFSWDLFLQNYRALMRNGDDLIAIRQLAKQGRWRSSWDYQQELTANGLVILVTSNNSKIVFASQNIAAMTGYESVEVTGKTPKMFQGKESDGGVRSYMRARIIAMQPFDATLINYKKNGDTYYCHIKSYPVFNDDDELVNYIAFEQAA